MRLNQITQKEDLLYMKSDENGKSNQHKSMRLSTWKSSLPSKLKLPQVSSDECRKSEIINEEESCSKVIEKVYNKPNEGKMPLTS